MEKEFVLEEFMNISKYLTEIEWIRCYNLFLKRTYSRKYIAQEMHEISRRLRANAIANCIESVEQ